MLDPGIGRTGRQKRRPEECHYIEERSSYRSVAMGSLLLCVVGPASFLPSSSSSLLSVFCVGEKTKPKKAKSGCLPEPRDPHMQRESYSPNTKDTSVLFAGPRQAFGCCGPPSPSGMTVRCPRITPVSRRTTPRQAYRQEKDKRKMKNRRLSRPKKRKSCETFHPSLSPHPRSPAPGYCHHTSPPITSYHAPFPPSEHAPSFPSFFPFDII